MQQYLQEGSAAGRASRAGRTHPLVFIHPFEGVLGQRVFSVPQLSHHGTQQLWRGTGEAPGEMTLRPQEHKTPVLTPTMLKSVLQLEPWLS